MGEICEVCGKNNLSNMGAHLRKAHDMSTDEYNEWLQTKNSANDNDNDLKEHLEKAKALVAELQSKIEDSEKGNDVVPTPEGSDIGELSDVEVNEIEKHNTEKVDIEPTINNYEESEKVGDVTPAEYNEMLFDHVERKDPDRPLSEFLKECDLTEGELINIVRQYWGDGTIPVHQKIKHDTSRGATEAAEIAKRNPPKTTTTAAHVAQVLEEKFGYKVVEVQSPNKMGISPKKYILEKVE